MGFSVGAKSLGENPLEPVNPARIFAMVSMLVPHRKNVGWQKADVGRDEL